MTVNAAKRVFVGHLGLFLDANDKLNCEVDACWLHQLVAVPDVLDRMFHDIPDDGWPQGFYHVYATPPGGAARVDVFDCACDPSPTLGAPGIN